MEINTSKVLKGFVEYKESTYPFFYENGLLNIMPNTKEKWNEEKDKLLDSLLGDDTYDLDWIVPEQIKGKLSDGDEVLFSVSGIPSNDNGFIGFDVDKIFTYNPDFISTKNISGIRVYGDEINYFLNPAKTYQCEIKFNKINTNIAESLKISSEFSKLFDCGIYTYNDVDINIRIEIITSLHSKSSSPTSSRSQLKFDFSNTVDINFVYDTIHHCNKFFKYICGRTNINLNEFVILNKEKRKSGNVVLLKHIEKEFNKNRQNKIIKYDYLTTNTAKLFNIISGPEMYYEHLQSSISEKNKYTISRIITTMVAFEREFRNIYSDTYKRSDKFYESRNEVVKAIESLKENSSGKKRNI